MQTLLQRTVELLRVLVAHGQREVEVLLGTCAAVNAAVDVGTDEEPKELLDPECVLMRGLNCIKQLSAELLHIMLLEGLCLSPLEAPQEVACMPRLSLRL